MNLVKAQEYAQLLPLAELQKYADGLNPSMIPPWLATGEMQAKIKRAEMANTLQGAAQGQQPSVKEQVEQKAGLMALQQAQQQGMQQQMMQPRPGMGPVPEGVPQPNPQPQAPGLNQLPSNIQMAGGGIVAFAGPTGSDVKGKDKNKDEDDESSQFAQDIAKLPQSFDELKQRVREEDAIKAAQDRRMEQRKQEMLEAREKTSLFNYLFGSPAREKEGLSKLAELSNLPLATMAEKPTAVPGAPLNAETQKLLNLAATRSDTGVNTNPALRPSVPPVAGTASPAQLAAAQNKPPRPPAMPAPAAPAAPAVPAPDSMEAMFRTSLENKPKERTVQDLIAEQNAIRAGTGLGEDAGKAKLERIAALNKQYEATKPTGLQELIEMFGQSGQYKGLSGLAPAYTNIESRKRAADLAQAKSINELMGAVEDTQRAEKTGVAGKVSEGRGKDRELGSQFDREKMQSLGTASTSEAQRKTQERGQDLTYRAAMAQVAATAARNNMELTANQRALLADKALDNVNATLKANLKLQMAVGSNPALMQQLLRAETERLMSAAGGATMPTAPGAGSPGGTTRLQFDAKGNQIK
jgi:hypothetical protein